MPLLGDRPYRRWRHRRRWRIGLRLPGIGRIGYLVELACQVFALPASTRLDLSGCSRSFWLGPLSAWFDARAVRGPRWRGFPSWLRALPASPPLDGLGFWSRPLNPRTASCLTALECGRNGACGNERRNCNPNGSHISILSSGRHEGSRRGDGIPGFGGRRASARRRGERGQAPPDSSSSVRTIRCPA